MQDGIIAGNGNSRYLKTVAAALSLYPDYESFMAALISGTFPIDLNGINAGGWTQQGTPLNKANLFSDTTASSLGLSASNSPNDAIARLKQLIDGANTNANTRVLMSVGSYVGTDTFGISNPCSISANFPIQFAMLLGYQFLNGTSNFFDFNTISKQSYNICTKIINTSELLTTDYTKHRGFFKEYNYDESDASFCKTSSDKKTISWYHTKYAESQFNESRFKYFFVLLG